MSNRFLVADFLSSMMNCARSASLREFTATANKLCIAVAGVLLESGYISGYEVKTLENGRTEIVAQVRFIKNRQAFLRLIKLYSKPSRYFYVSVKDIKSLLQRHNFSTFILSTSKGVCSARRAIEMGVGGELLCMVL